MSDENPVRSVEGMEEEAKDVVKDMASADGESAVASEKENIDPGANVGSAAVDGVGGSGAADGAVAGPSGAQAARPNVIADGGVGGVLDAIPEERLIEICRGAVQRMGTLQRTEFPGHFSGVLANDANAFGLIIHVSGVVHLLISV